MVYVFQLLIQTALSQTVITRWNLLDSFPNSGQVLGECPGACYANLGYTTGNEAEDPIYAPSRGYYFGGSQVMSITPGSFTIPNVYTVESWVTLDDDSNLKKVIFNKSSRDPSTGETQFMFRIQEDKLRAVRWSDYLGSKYIWQGTFATSLQLNTWYHMAMTVDGNTIVLYENTNDIQTWTSSDPDDWNDLASNEIYLSWDLDTGQCSDFFMGFMSQFIITEDVVTNFSHSTCSSCSSWGSTTWNICEQSDWTCRPTCSVGTYPDWSSETCESWNGGPCTDSWSGNPQSWDMWYGQYCDAWTGPDPSDCTNWVSNSIYHPVIACDAWFMDCATCFGSAQNNCITCQASHAIAPAQECVWDAGYYASGHLPLLCQQCAQACATWTGGTSSDCVTCATGYTDQPAGSSTWVSLCPDGQYVSFGWVPCDPACKTCSAGTDQDWNECNSGYYQNPLSQQWLIWDQACKSWSAGADSDCIECNSGYYYHPLRSEWLICDQACKSWSAGTDSDCIECNSGYYWQFPGQTSNICVSAWDDGFYLDLSTQAWKICHAECATCYNSDNLSWFTCVAGLYKQPSSNICGETCPDGTYPDTATTLCEECHADCSTCYGALAQNWTKCRNPDQQVIQGKWKCRNGFYSDPNNSASWFLCPQDWATCSSGDTWLTCTAQHAIPIEGICSWVQPFLRSSGEIGALECLRCPKNAVYDSVTAQCELECSEAQFVQDFECQSCEADCEEWNDTDHCVQCSDGFFVDKNFSCSQCEQTWQTCTEYSSNCTSCTSNLLLVENQCVWPTEQVLSQSLTACVDLIHASILTSDNNQVTIQFSSDLNDELTTDEIEVKITNENGSQIDFEYSLIRSNENYTIKISSEEDIPSGSTFSLVFSNQFIYAMQISAETQHLSVELNQQNSESTEDELERQEQSESATSSGSAATVSAAAFMASLSYNLSALWKIINYLQIITLFQFYNMKTTPELDGFLSSLLKDSRIPNIYDAFLPEDYDVVTMPSRFRKSNYEHPLVLDTFGHSLTIWIFISLMLGTAYILRNSQINWVSKLSSKILQLFIYNGIIRTILETSVYIFIGWFLNLKYGYANETHSMLNLSCSLFLLLLILIFSMTSAYFIAVNNGKLGDEKKHYQELTKELKDDPLKLNIYFILIFLFRRAAICAIVVFIEGVKLQIIIGGFLNLSYLAWLMTCHPFESTFANAVEIYWEWIVVITNFSLLIFLTDYDNKDQAGKVAIYLIISAIGVYMLIIIRNFIKKIHDKCKSWKSESKIHPQASLEVNITREDTEGKMKNPDSIANITSARDDNVPEQSRKIN